MAYLGDVNADMKDMFNITIVPDGHTIEDILKEIDADAAKAPDTPIDEFNLGGWDSLLDSRGKKMVRTFRKIAKLFQLIHENRSIDKIDMATLTFNVPIKDVSGAKVTYDCHVIRQDIEVALLGGYQSIYAKIKDILIRLCSDVQPTKEELLFLNDEYKKESRE